ILKCVDEFDPDFYDDAGITTSGLTLLGLSGMGKSRAVNRILSFIYQVIHHREYQGRPFTCSQIVWLKLDCPHNGSIKALCGACLQAVDSLLGTDYFRRGAQNGKASVNTLIAQMAIVAANHYLGVLVIDEIQNIRGSKEGTQLLNFLVQLSNEIGIPMVLVGTPSAQGVLTSAFRQARRGTGYGNFLWHHMKAERNGGNGDWEVFVRSLFRYQYVHEVAVLTPKLSDALLETSGGITDLAIKMFIAAQRRAITTGTERITPGLIRSVAHDEFPWTIEAVKALKKGTPSALRRYDDLYFEQEKSSMPKVTAPATASPPPKKKKSVTATEEPDWQAAETEAELPETTQVGLADTHTAETPQQEIGPTLVGIVAQGSEREQPAYEAVQAAGLIWSTDSHLTPSE
ncbi:MAG: ATP-binding protein, partial [Anaerolineae bacterium]|nr:ATP-binding protein [Anaerolineae bacterium]